MRVQGYISFRWGVVEEKVETTTMHVAGIQRPQTKGPSEFLDSTYLGLVGEYGNFLDGLSRDYIPLFLTKH